MFLCLASLTAYTFPCSISYTIVEVVSGWNIDSLKISPTALSCILGEGVGSSNFPRSVMILLFSVSKVNRDVTKGCITDSLISAPTNLNRIEKGIRCGSRPGSSSEFGIPLIITSLYPEQSAKDWLGCNKILQE